MDYLMLAWLAAFAASPQGTIFGALIGIAIGIALPHYYLAKMVTPIWFGVIMFCAIILGCYLFALAGGFLTGSIEYVVTLLKSRL